MDQRLVKFLQPYETKRGEKLWTHTSKIKPCRSYYIQDEDLNEFYNIYNTVISEGGTAGITEKPDPVVPLFVDIDFKCNLDNGIKRYYTARHIAEIVGIYQELISELAVEPTEKMYYCVVLEKTTPVQRGEFCKDGFHLHFPYFFTEQWVQKEYIRPEVIARCKNRKILDDIPMIESLDKVFDKNIPSVAWLMYGSRKEPHCEPYLLSKILNREGERMNIKTCFKKRSDGTREWNLPRYLSVRPGVDPTPLNSDLIVKKQTINKVCRRQRFNRDLDVIVSELITARRLIQMLSTERASYYTSWLEIGWILYNISESHEKGLELWIEFSRQTDRDNFVEGECEKLWGKMEIRNYSLATLKFFARIDSPSEYATWKNEQINYLLTSGITMAHNDIANILHIMFEGQFICACNAKNIWYKFSGHRWVLDSNAISLTRHMSHTLVNKYLELNSKLSNDTKLLDENDGQRLVNIERIKLITKLIDKLKNNSFKNAILKEAMEYFYDKDFIEKMDENPNLLVCENGVYDATTKEFRDGRPEDYCTKTTKIYYRHFEDNDPQVVKLRNIFRKIFVNRDLLKFFRQTVSDLICGGNRHKIFVIWTGAGDNGKSICAYLLEKTLGEYYYTPPTSLLTGKQASSGNATQELIPCKGARVVVLSETDNADVLNCGTMKKLTGGDSFYARGIFKESVTITPQFKVLLHCNKMPKVSAEDKASWNRIRVLPFESTFPKEESVPETEEEQFEKKIFPRDNSLKEELPHLTEAFLWMLINDYEFFGNDDLFEPSQVVNATDCYQKTNDFYLQFMDEKLIETNDKKDKLTSSLIYEFFKDWYKTCYPGNRIPSKVNFEEALDKKMGQRFKGVWKGWSIYDPQAGGDPEDSTTF